MKKIKLLNFTKNYNDYLGQGYQVYLKSNFEIKEGERIGLLGVNGAGKTTLCNLVSGNESLTSGSREVVGSVSWPIGVYSSLSANLTGNQNIAFVCNLLNLNYEKMRSTVLEAAELNIHANRKISTYSAGMKAKLSFFLSLAIDFDFFIFDEVTSVGDQSFRNKADAIFKDTLSGKGMILCSHNFNLIKKHCTKCYIINDKTISPKYSIDTAKDIYDGIISKKN